MGATLEGLRKAAMALLPGSSIVLSREVLLEALEGLPVPPAGSPETSVDLSIGQVADRYGRAPSTVRGWINAGSLPGSYRLRGREWRVPPGALAEFEDAERHARVDHASRQGKNGALSDWRALKNTEGA